MFRLLLFVLLVCVMAGVALSELFPEHNWSNKIRGVTRGRPRLFDDALGEIESKAVTLAGTVFIPNDVRIEAHPADFDVEPRTFSRLLVGQLESRATANGYQFAAPIVVSAISSDAQPQGHPLIFALVTAPTAMAAAALPASAYQNNNPMFMLRSSGFGSVALYAGSAVRLGFSELQNDFVVDDPRVSRRHATVRLESSSRQVMVLDDKSSNGTFVDGRRLEPGVWTALAERGRLHLGGCSSDFPSWILEAASAGSTC